VCSSDLQRRPDLSPVLDGWFARALARDPLQRFQSAKEMAEAFVAAADDGAHTAAAFRLPQASLSGVNAGLAAAVAAPSPSNPWGTNPTNPAMPLGNAHRASSTELPAPVMPSPAVSAPPPAWQSSSLAQQPAPHQTFPGASVTHAERGGSSRRTVVAAMAAAIGLVTLVLILAIVLVLRSEPSEPASAGPQPVVSVAASAAPTEAPPALTPSTAPVAATSAADTTTAKTIPVVKPNSTVKPRRDRGF